MMIDRGIRISATTTRPLQVTAAGKPARLAIVDDQGQIIAVGDEVAWECAAVMRGALERYWEAQGWLETVNVPQTLAEAAEDLAGAMTVSGR